MDRLPPELILRIILMLSPEEFINFVFADYSLLVDKGMAPRLTAGTISRLIQANQDRTILARKVTGYLWFPVELSLEILRYLQPTPFMLVSYVIANYVHLAQSGVTIPLQGKTLYRLHWLERLRWRPAATRRTRCMSCPF